MLNNASVQHGPENSSSRLVSEGGIDSLERLRPFTPVACFILIDHISAMKYNGGMGCLSNMIHIDSMGCIDGMKYITTMKNVDSMKSSASIESIDRMKSIDGTGHTSER